MLRSLLLVVTLGIPSLLSAQHNRPLADAGTSICEYPRSQGGMGKWVASKSGFAAAVEIKASVTQAGDGRRCTTSWIVHRRGEDGHVSTIKVAERDDRPDEGGWSQENSFEIDAFSRDGKKVLLSQIEAQSDWDETTPIVFDLTDNMRWRIELYPLFKEQNPRRLQRGVPGLKVHQQRKCSDLSGFDRD